MHQNAPQTADVAETFVHRALQSTSAALRGHALRGTATLGFSHQRCNAVHVAPGYIAERRPGTGCSEDGSRRNSQQQWSLRKITLLIPGSNKTLMCEVVTRGSEGELDKAVLGARVHVDGQSEHVGKRCLAVGVPQ
jgi:hypothetical protein